MLLEAAQTGCVLFPSICVDFVKRILSNILERLFYFPEIYNRQSLEDMLAREEEVKKRAVIQKEIFAGPQIRFRSKDGYIFFSAIFFLDLLVN